MMPEFEWVARCPDCNCCKYFEVYPPKDVVKCEDCNRGMGLSSV